MSFSVRLLDSKKRATLTLSDFSHANTLSDFIQASSFMVWFGAFVETLLIIPLPAFEVSSAAPGGIDDQYRASAAPDTDDPYRTNWSIISIPSTNMNSES